MLAFYNPDNPAALESIKEAREGARRLKIVLVERRVASVDELRSGLRSIRAGEVDGLVHIADVLATSHGYRNFECWLDIVDPRAPKGK